MKTVRDVIEHFGGVWPDSKYLFIDVSGSGFIVAWYGTSPKYDYDVISRGDDVLDANIVLHITKEQFEEEARKMSNEQWLTGPDGKQYQKGAVYELSGNGGHWIVDKLERITARYFLAELGGARKYIRECQAALGKIKEPEIVPEDGCWYLCEAAGEWRDVYYYSDGFFCFRGNTYMAEDIKIIKKVDV